MNERLFLKLLLALFSVLLVAEPLLALLYGFRLELMLFSFLIAVALIGILVTLRFLLPQRAEIDSVSARRAKARRSDVMRDRLKAYSIDEEFLGGESFTRQKGREAEPPPADSHSSRKPQGESMATLEEAIKAHARMYGGLVELLRMMEKLDEIAFRQLVKKAGLGQISREEVIIKITLMLQAQSSPLPDGDDCEDEEPSIMPGHTLDKESFDDYIRRCMSGAGDDEKCAEGISVDLNDAALLQAKGSPPEDFEHNPKSVIASLKRAGIKS